MTSDTIKAGYQSTRPCGTIRQRQSFYTSILVQIIVPFYFFYYLYMDISFILNKEIRLNNMENNQGDNLILIIHCCYWMKTHIILILTSLYRKWIISCCTRGRSLYHDIINNVKDKEYLIQIIAITELDRY